MTNHNIYSLNRQTFIKFNTMKTIILMFVSLAFVQAAALTQCGVNHKELLDKYCSGVYLQHQELDNARDRKVTFLLKEGDRYALYFLNPSKMLPEFMLRGSKTTEVMDVVSKVNKKDNISFYSFIANETGEYVLSYNFGTNEDACVLMAIYLQNQTLFKPGIYNNFDEMKYNNPSTPLEHKILSRSVKIGGTSLIFYQLKSNRKISTSRNYYGFSDGKNIFIRQKESAGLKSEFVKIDIFGNYGLFEDISVVATGTVAIPFLTHNILDMNTGNIKRLDRKYVRDFIADDKELLEAFDNESNKATKLREYVVQYLTK